MNNKRRFKTRQIKERKTIFSRNLFKLFQKAKNRLGNRVYYFNKWSKDGSFKRIWVNLLVENRKKLDLSSVQLDGSHTRCRLGSQSGKFLAKKNGKND